MNSRERAQKMLSDLIDTVRAEARREALEEAIAAIAKEQAPWGFTLTNATYERAIRALKEKTP